MAQTQIKISAVNDETLDTRPPIEQFEGRESKEVIIAFSGAVGSGIELAIEEVEKNLKSNGYDVEKLKISDLIIKASEHEIDTSTLDSRYKNLQTAGNDLRKKYHNDILAELTISMIASKRVAKRPKDQTLATHIPNKTAYLIDQLKHPAEVELLSSVYGNLFYMIGVVSNYQFRKKLLTQNKKLNLEDAEAIMDRDKKEAIKHGQQLDKTLLLADYFIRNNSNRELIERQVNRLIELIHGKNGVTPTQHEYAMYMAYSAGLKSACLSRQVGASITNADGNILATGCNDVPKAGGGLYNESDRENDRRCVKINGAECSNDLYKNDLGNKIKEKLEQGGVAPELAEELLISIKDDTRLKDLIEFSRSVHAEMDAITSIARTGGIALTDGYLYTTTFPCHNCARHIIASGIKKVYFIEPYEKSLALELHQDSLEVETEEINSNKVQILHFEGVAPRKYLNFFTPKGERKDKQGKAIFSPILSSLKVNREYLDSYQHLELKVIEHLQGQDLNEKILTEKEPL